MLKRPSIKPYDVKNGDGGMFTTVNEQPLDSPVIGVRLPASIYARFVASVGTKKKADWIREAIAEKLERENS